MAAVAVILLVVGVSGSIARPWRLPAWLFPVAAAVLTLAAGALAPDDAWSAPPAATRSSPTCSG